MPFDIIGLPEFFIDTVQVEPCNGGMVRMYCGAKRHNEVVHWLYSCVMPAEALILTTSECRIAADRAWNTQQFALDKPRH